MANTKAIRFRDMGERSTDMIYVDPKTIVVEEGFNARDFSQPGMAERLDGLAASITEVGVLQPLWVRVDAGKLILVDGETRLKATLLAISRGAEILTIPAIKVVAGNVAERKLLSLTANTGKPLEKWEAGVAYKQLFGWGWSYESIAKRVGETPRYVGEAIELADTPAEVRAMMAKGEITPRLALKEIRDKGDKAVESLTWKVAEAKAEGKTQAKAERKTTTAKLEDICRAIMNDSWPEYEPNERMRVAGDKDFFEHISVRHTLLRKMFVILNAEDGE